MYRSHVIGLLAGSIGFISVAQATVQQTCTPALAFKEIRFSEMQLPALERKWTATLSVDASRCATTSGRFEIIFSRSKEIGMEIEFRERFMWQPELVEVSVDFWVDEWVDRYRLDNVATCPCRD